jgi:hypothetical protein
LVFAIIALSLKSKSVLVGILFCKLIGSFGVVYCAFDRESNDFIALKVEKLKDNIPVSLNFEEKNLSSI